VAGRLTSRPERNALAGRAASGETCLRARIRARVAFRTFQSVQSVTRRNAVNLGPRILRGVQYLSVRFPPQVCRENWAMGCRSISWAVEFLSGVCRRPKRLSEPGSRSRAHGICCALAARIAYVA